MEAFFTFTQQPQPAIPGIMRVPWVSAHTTWRSGGYRARAWYSWQVRRAVGCNMRNFCIIGKKEVEGGYSTICGEHRGNRTDAEFRGFFAEHYGSFAYSNQQMQYDMRPCGRN